MKERSQSRSSGEQDPAGKFRQWPSRPLSPWTAGAALIATLAAAGWFGTGYWGPGRLSLRESQGKGSIELDGRRGAWGFNLEPALIPLELIVDAPPSRDAIAALNRPDILPAGGLDRGQSAIPPEIWIAGVVVDGQARAYPEPLLAAHECINDELGGEPIGVTYHGLGDALVAFSRRVDGRVLEFGVSGLLYQSNQLLFDRQPDPHAESLWSQARLRAVTGPAAGAGLRLEPIDVERANWTDWVRRHPDTTLATLNTGYFLDYTANRYQADFDSEEWLFPVEGRSARRPDLPDKSPLVVVRIGAIERAYAIKDLHRAGGSVLDRLGDASLRLTVEEGSAIEQVRVDPVGPGEVAFARRYLFWALWDALEPEGDLYAAPAAEGARD